MSERASGSFARTSAQGRADGFSSDSVSFEAIAAVVETKSDSQSARSSSSSPSWSIWRVIRLLRLAVALHHRRLDHLLPPLRLEAEGRLCRLFLPASWCDENRLLMQNLEREQQYLLNHGWELEWLPTNP